MKDFEQVQPYSSPQVVFHPGASLKNFRTEILYHLALQIFRGKVTGDIQVLEFSGHKTYTEGKRTYTSHLWSFVILFNDF